MAERAKAKAKSGKGKVSSRGTVATLPKKGGKPGKGHNSDMHAVPDEVILRHINTMKTKMKTMDKVQEELDQARGVYRLARKLAKKEGVNLAAFDMVIRLEKQDHGAVLVDHADAGRYLRITESPLATQMDLFQNLQAPAPVVDVALQGQKAGENGEPMTNNPHTPGSDDYTIWHENWTLGQTKIAEEMRH